MRERVNVRIVSFCAGKRFGDGDPRAVVMPVILELKPTLLGLPVGTDPGTELW